MIVILFALMIFSVKSAAGFSSNTVGIGDTCSGHMQSFDYWIVGAGTLGNQVVQKLSNTFPASKIVSETATIRNHAMLQEHSFPILRSSRESGHARASNNVLFCVPPSSCNNYLQEVTDSLKLWSGSGSYVFVSSTAVYGNIEGEMSEISPVDASNPRSSL